MTENLAAITRSFFLAGQISHSVTDLAIHVGARALAVR